MSTLIKEDILYIHTHKELKKSVPTDLSREKTEPGTAIMKGNGV